MVQVLEHLTRGFGSSYGIKSQVGLSSESAWIPSPCTRSVPKINNFEKKIASYNSDGCYFCRILWYYWIKKPFYWNYKIALAFINLNLNTKCCMLSQSSECEATSFC